MANNNTKGAKPTDKKPDQTPEKIEPKELTVSQKFTKRVMREFQEITGTGLNWGQLQQQLAQSLYIKIDMTLAELETKRLKDAQGSGEWAKKAQDKKPMTWANVNLDKLAVAGVRIVKMELDASMKNIVHPVLYFNSSTGLYDITLMMGYMGMMQCMKRLALEPIRSGVIRLVYEKDHFVPHLKDINCEVESYEHTKGDPFDPGKVVGGFCYLSYDDPTMNQLILVRPRDFDRARAASSNKGPESFWGKNEEEMQYKTIIRRAFDKVQLDPVKVNMIGWNEMLAETIDVAEAEIVEEAKDKANQTPAMLPPRQEVIETPPPATATPEPVASQNEERTLSELGKTIDPSSGEVVEKPNAGGLPF